jgi:hypothetical protein
VSSISYIPFVYSIDSYLPNTVQIQKGVNASRADDTKGMKGTIIEWITPADRELTPRLNRKHKFDRGFWLAGLGAGAGLSFIAWRSSFDI